MFISEDVPSSYKYLYEIGDNYIALTNSSHAVGSYMQPDEISVYYQYFVPSFQVLKTSRDVYSEVYYDNVSSQFSDNFFDRADAPVIFICQFIVCVWFVWLLNQLSKLVHKGGIFGA